MPYILLIYTKLSQPNYMTIQEKIADYRRKAQNGSLPPSAKAKFLQLADELESQLQANKNDAAPDYDKLLHKDKAPKRKSSGQTKKAANSSTFGQSLVRLCLVSGRHLLQPLRKPVCLRQ
jgi:uncharacterized coiled-coil DUF342 family protein